MISRDVAWTTGELFRLSPSVYRYRDICNVYLVVRDDHALLVDFASGSVLDTLSSLGVEHLDWVLHTHHHRDQCQGDLNLKGSDTRIAVPEKEVGYFTHAETFWQELDVYDRYDCTNVYSNAGSNIEISHVLSDYSVFHWQGIDFSVVPTPGHTRGSITLVAEIDGIRYAFSGDLIAAPGRVLTLHDLVWRYGFAEGVSVAVHSARELRKVQASCLATSHGEVIDQPQLALELLEENLVEYLSWCDRGYQTTAPKSPSWPESTVTQISDHLIAVTGTCANFYVLRGDDGTSLFFDYGFASEQHMSASYRFVQHSLSELESRFDIQPPAVVIPTHYHDDHVSGISFLKSTYGTEVWAFEAFADIIQRPNAYRIPCLWPEAIQVNRVLRDRERFVWKGHAFEVRHNPGHTWFAAAFFGEIDGLSVALTGDAVKYAADGTLWGGSPTFRNRVGSDDFVTCIETISEYEPAVLLTGHWGPIEVSARELEPYRRWAEGLARSMRRVVVDPSELGFAADPDFVSVTPYESVVRQGDNLVVDVEVRNHHAHDAVAAIRLVLPESWQSKPGAHRRVLLTGEVARFRFAIAIPETVEIGVRHVVFADVDLGERRFGHIAEGLVMVRNASICK